MSLFKTDKGIAVFVTAKIQNIDYKEAEGNDQIIECTFQAEIDDMLYDFKCAWDRVSALLFYKGEEYLMDCRLLISEDKMLLFVNNAAPTSKLRYEEDSYNSNNHSSENQEENHFEDFIKVEGVKHDNIQPENSEPPGDSPPQEPLEKIEEPNCKTVAEEVQYEEPQQNDEDGIPF